jgi:hypothetical protein
LELRLPAIPGAAVEDTWVANIGHVLLRRVKVWLNETLLSDHERLWYDLHEKLFVPPHLHEFLQTHPLSLATSHTIIVPLKLPWSLSNFFPLVAMPGVSMTMEVDAESFQNCISIVPRVDAVTGDIIRATFRTSTLVVLTLLVSASSRTVTLRDHQTTKYTVSVPAGTTGVNISLATPWEVTEAVCNSAVRRITADTLAFPARNDELDVRCLFEYAILDVEERRSILRDRLVWQFDTVVDMEAKTYKETLSMDGSIGRMSLPTAKINLTELNLPVRGLVWVVYDENYGRDYFTYDPTAIESAQLHANNTELTARLPGAYFQLMTRVSRAGICATGLDGVHYLPLCLHPTTLQSSGALGFDRAKQPYLDVVFSATKPLRGVVKVFAIVRRVLQLHKGHAAFLTM